MHSNRARCAVVPFEALRTWLHLPGALKSRRGAVSEENDDD